MPNYGPNGKSTETVAEWLLGDRKWRVLAEFATRPGVAFRVDELVERSGCAEPTVYEFIRALRPTHAIRRDDGRYLLDPDDVLADALISLVRALRAHRGQLVDRPRRRRR